MCLVVLFNVACGEQAPIERRVAFIQSSDQVVVEEATETTKKKPLETPEESLPPVVTVPEPGLEPTPPTLEEVIQLGLDAIDLEIIKEELTYISSDEHEGRLSGTKGNETIADYLIGHLEDLGVSPGLESGYLQEFRIQNGPTSGQGTANIVGVIRGQDEVLKDEYIVIGAHMDHAGMLSKGYTCSSGDRDSNQICNGADDNGSGTIGLLNVTKALAKVQKHLKRSVVVIWFSGEELGLEGSWHYVRNPIFPLEKTVYMMNLDMIGYAHTNQQRVSGLGGGTSSAAENFIKELDDKYDLTVDITAQAGGGSDHVPFMAEGIPGVFFHTGVANNPNYHKTSDTAEKISYEGLTTIAEMSFELIHYVANNEESFSVPVGVAGTSIKRAPLVTKAEQAQSCHHLILNPYVEKMSSFMQSGKKNP